MKHDEHPGNIGRCNIIGSRKNKMRIKHNKPSQRAHKKYERFVMNSLIECVFQRMLICLITNITINEMCFINCHIDMQNAITNNILKIHQKWNDLEHGWLFIDVIYGTKQKLIVHRDDTIKDLFTKLSNEITYKPSDQFYIKIQNQFFHITQLDRLKLSLAQLLVTHNEEIIVEELLLGGARKRDKEEADLTSSDDDELQPNRKKQKQTSVTNIIDNGQMQTNNSNYSHQNENNQHNVNSSQIIVDEFEENYEDYRNFMQNHNPPQIDENHDLQYDAQYDLQRDKENEEERKYPDEFDEQLIGGYNSGNCNHNHAIGRHCSHCQFRYNVCSDEELLHHTLLEFDDDFHDAFRSQSNNEFINESDNKSDNESDNEFDDEFPSINETKKGKYYPPRKRGRKRKKPLLYKRNRKYNEKMARRAERHASVSHNWDSKQWISKLYWKKEKSTYKDPKFKIKGGIDKLRSTLSKYKENYIGKMDHECPHCGALLFKSELSDPKTGKWNMCCKNGKITLKPILNPPQELHHLFTQNDRLSKYFQENIVMLNSALAMSSSQIFRKELPHSHRRAPPTFILSGAVYHTVPRLLPDSNATPKQAQIYTWDPAEETNHRLNQGFLGKISSEPKFRQLVKELQQLLHEYNWVVKMYKNIFEQHFDGSHTLPQLKLILHTKVSDQTNLGHYKIFSKPTENSPIATLIEFSDLTDPVPSHRKLVLTTRKKGENRTLLDCHALSDALAFPLLYPYGECAYDLDYKDSNGEKITMTQYYRYRLLERKNQWNPFIHGQRLFQKFITATWGKIQQNTMNWYINNQKKCRADSYESISLARQQNTELKQLGRKLNILPRSFVESPRYFRSKYQNAMAILRRMNSIPDFFITFTANPNWKEVNETLEMHDVSLSCRDDIIARVFRAKLKQFLKDITQSNGLGLLHFNCVIT